MGPTPEGIRWPGPLLRATLLRDLIDWLKAEPAQGSLISTSLADHLLARGWTRPVAG